MSLRRRLVLVHRRTEYEELLRRHGTRGQAEFFLRTRGRDLAQVQALHDAVEGARAAVAAAVPPEWAWTEVEREDLGRFLFAPEDVVLVVGQDGLVANVAASLDGQPVIGVDPLPGENAGVLVRHSIDEVPALLGRVEAGTLSVRELTMVRAQLDDGQELTALNEVFVGHPSHQSARYVLAGERQSSSGLVVGTGTGATGWCASLAHERGGRELPAPQEPRLAWFVREAWPSPRTGVEHTEGSLGPGQTLELRVDSDELVVFGDGMEAERLTATWGQTVRISIAPRTLRLV